MALLKKFFPDHRDKKAIATAVEKLHNDEQERKRQKTVCHRCVLHSGCQNNVLFCRTLVKETKQSEILSISLQNSIF